MTAELKSSAGQQSMVGTSERSLIGLLLVVTFTTGMMDAVSVLGLGHVFTASMTGNVVFLGFALWRAHRVTRHGCMLRRWPRFSSAR